MDGQTTDTKIRESTYISFPFGHMEEGKGSESRKMKV